MLSVQEATDRILAAFRPLGPEIVALDQALGRVLAVPVTARLDHPPQAVSAMDGYAVRAADVAKLPARLKVVLTIAALTVYDMCKAVDRGMRIDDIRLVHKSGGRSGSWSRP